MWILIAHAEAILQQALEARRPIREEDVQGRKSFRKLGPPRGRPKKNKTTNPQAKLSQK